MILSFLSSSVFCETNWHVFCYVDCVRTKLTYSTIACNADVYSAVSLFYFCLLRLQWVKIAPDRYMMMMIVTCRALSVFKRKGNSNDNDNDNKTNVRRVCCTANCIQTYVVTCYMFAFTHSLPFYGITSQHIKSHMRLHVHAHTHTCAQVRTYAPHIHTLNSSRN